MDTQTETISVSSNSNNAETTGVSMDTQKESTESLAKTEKAEKEGFFKRTVESIKKGASFAWGKVVNAFNHIKETFSSRDGIAKALRFVSTHAFKLLGLAIGLVAIGYLMSTIGAVMALTILAGVGAVLTVVAAMVDKTPVRQQLGLPEAPSEVSVDQKQAVAC